MKKKKKIDPASPEPNQQPGQLEVKVNTPVFEGFSVVSAELHRTAPPAANVHLFEPPFTARECESDEV